MDLKGYLESYGLDAREAKLYLVLLEIGESTASSLSKKSKILRQTVYELLDKLLNLGLVKLVTKNNVKYFEAVDPERLNSLLIEKQEIVKKILPSLKKLQDKELSKQNVSSYVGIEGLKAIYSRIIKDSPKELLEYGSSKQFIEILKFHFVQNYMRKRVSNKTKLRLITEPGKTIENLYKSDNKLLRETRFSKEMKDVKTATYIYGDIFISISLGDEPKGVLIEDANLANTQRIIFEKMWG